MKLMRMACGLVAAWAMAAPVSAETKVGTNIDGRVILGFNVDDGAANAWLPEGWTIFALPKGPFAGTEVMLVLIDRALQLDPDGKPAPLATSQSAALVGYAVQPGAGGGPRVFVLRVYETAPIADSYGNGIAAAITAERTLRAAGGEARQRSEDWVVAPEAGGEIRVSLDYAMGTPGWSEAEVTPFSAARPDFSRIYRYRQLADLAASDALGKPLDGSLSYEVSVPELAALFDGTETSTAVLSVPVYLRDVFLP